MQRAYPLIVPLLRHVFTGDVLMAVCRLFDPSEKNRAEEDFSAGPTSHFADLVFTFALTPAVPEPSVWLLLGVAVAGAASLRRRYSKS